MKIIDDMLVKDIFTLFKKVKLEKDDVIVVSVKGYISDAAYAYIERRMKEVFPKNQSLIFDSGVSIKAIITPIRKDIEKKVKEKITGAKHKKITDDDVRDIRKKAKSGLSNKCIADYYKISEGYVYNIVKRKARMSVK